MQAVANAFGVRAPAGAQYATSSPARSGSSIPLAVPRLPLQAAGAALLASSTLLLAPLPASALDMSFAGANVKASLEARDEAMDFKCKGGMFDCDSDRRDFAKDQYKTFVSRMEAKEKGLPVPPPLKSGQNNEAMPAAAADETAPAQ